MLHLNEEFQRRWAGKDPFAEVNAIEGQVFRQVNSRRTFRFEMDGQSFFAKVHHGVGWREILKNLFQFKATVLGAANEFEALEALRSQGIETMTPCAFGQRGINPASLESFIITAELKNTISLEDFCKDWRSNPPPASLKHALIRKLAQVSGQMHSHGINHRDYYICHFLLDVSAGRERVEPSNLRVFMIDLHRAQIRRRTPRRWLVKDIAGLWFSAMDLGLSRRDLLRFVSLYSKAMLPDSAFWPDVNNTAGQLYRKEFGRAPDCTFQ